MTLVSVIISTYNSSRFIVETLESILNQKWPDVELIITDDSSTDNTIDICRQWVSDNSERFCNCRIITSEKNTGVSANANRGLLSASGVWVKFIGSDDTLLPDCLADNMQFIEDNPSVRVLFSRIDIYNKSFSSENYIETTPQGDITQESILWPGRSAESQYQMLLIADRIHFSPSVFMHRELVLSLGGFDERFRLLEDYPLWLKITRNGNKLHFMDKVTVNYRQHPGAINNTGRPFIVNPNYFRAEAFRRIYTYPFLSPLLRYEQKFRWVVLQIFRIKFLNQQTFVTQVLHNTISIYLNPFRYLIRIRKLIPGKKDYGYS